MKTEEMLELLPGVFARTASEPDSPLRVLLEAVEQVQARDEALLDGLDAFFDARRAPDAFLPYLSWWVDVAWTFLEPPDDPHATPTQPLSTGVGALRELVAAAGAEARWRGTPGALVRLLERATGLRGYRIEESVPFRIRLHAPAAAAPHLPLIRRILEHEKPAFVVLDPETLFEDPGAAGPTTRT
jgi:phage tail-like protein